MISSISANQINNIRNYSLKKQPAFSSQNYSADNKQISQANFPYYVPFKNLSKPIEVTDKYIKKTEGQEHLELPDIHVYEYPDTNLQVFINADSNIDLYSEPQLTLFILNPNPEDIIAEEIYHNILENKIAQGNPNAIISHKNSGFMFIPQSNKNIYKQISGVNSLINSKITDMDLYNAKNQLNNKIKSTDNQSEIMSKMYSYNYLYNIEELQNKINSISISDINKFQKKYLKNSYMQAFVTVSQNYYVSNKDILLKTLNNNISNKFKNRMEYNESVNDFIIEINDKQNSEIYDANEFLYPAIVQEGKQAIIDKIAILMLNNCTDWFKITSDGILERPVGLKKIECFDCDMKVYSVILSDNKTYSDFKESIDYFLQSNLKEETESAKNILKRKLNVIFNTDELDIIKHQELIDLECGIFNVYENINSINEDDIKQYVKRIFITQIPINNRKELL